MKNELDDFWDVDKLVPKRKKTISPFLTSSPLTDHTVTGETAHGAEERKLSFDSMSRGVTVTEDRTYEPGKGSLIRRVTIKQYADKYDFYGNFRKAALIYFDYKTDKCDFASYYSYMPQYSQLTAAQKNYYFYWRDCIRRGKYIKSDYSYIYLYVYEVLNLPDKIPPEEGLKLLCNIWREYRETLPRIDAYFSIWVQDYCLVYNLDCPVGYIGDFIFAVVGIAPLKEFYLSDIDGIGTGGVDALIAYLSDYDWRKGKFAGGENSEDYKRYMQGAMYAFVCYLNSEGLLTSGLSREVLCRDTFPHSLCTHAVKCKLEIEYSSLAHDSGVRTLVTSAVRYAENKLRALFGIKSRLAVKDFPDNAMAVIDRYFDRLFAAERICRAKENAPEYEKLYDAPREKLSFGNADEIERASWTTTARLVVDEDENDDKILTSEQITGQNIETEATDTTPAQADIFGLSPDDAKILLSVYRGECQLSDDSVAERINDAAVDSFGDIILELSDGCYTIIEDYKEEIERCLSNQ